jgi:hypothetical protein
VVDLETPPIQRFAYRTGASRLYRQAIGTIVKGSQAGEIRPANSVIEEGFGGVTHDQDYYRYKTYTRNFCARIDDVSIWFKLDGGLRVGDVQLAGEFDGGRILAAVTKLARQLGCKRIIFFVSRGTRLEQFLSGKMPGEEGTAICWLNMARKFEPGQLKFTFADWDTF